LPANGIGNGAGAGANGIDHATFAASLTAGTFPLKLPPQKVARLNGGDIHTSSNISSNKDSQPSQSLTIPQLPSSGTSAA